MLSQSRLITTQQHTEQVSLLRWLKNAWKKIEVIDKTHLRWSSTCDLALQCPLQEAETDFPQVFQGRKTITRFLADATTLLSGRGKEDPTILEALWWGVLLLGQISFLDLVFCFCGLTWTFCSNFFTGALMTLLTPLLAHSQSPTPPMTPTVRILGTRSDTCQATRSCH